MRAAFGDDFDYGALPEEDPFTPGSEDRGGTVKGQEEVSFNVNMKILP